MRIVGHFEDGKVVFDTPPPIADGSVVDVQVTRPAIPGDLTNPPAHETTAEWIVRWNDWLATLPQDRREGMEVVSNPKEMTPDEFAAYLQEIADSQPVCDWYVDVSRDSIYD